MDLSSVPASRMVPLIIIIHCCDETEDFTDDAQEQCDSLSSNHLSPPVSEYCHEENPWTFSNQNPFVMC